MTESPQSVLGIFRTEEQQKEVNDLLHALDESTILAITDEKGVITHVNDRFCEISGYSRDELIGNTHRLVHSGEHPKDFFQDLWKTIAAGEIWNGEIKNKAKDGSFYWVETTIFPSTNPKGKIRRYVAIRKDISEKKRLEEEVAQEHAKTLHAEKMASLGEVASGIAHEVGNPLAAMRAKMELMLSRLERGEESPEKLAKFLNDAIRISDRITKIIRGLRSYARDGSQDPMAVTDLGALIEDIVEFAEIRLRKEGIPLKRIGFHERILAECREAQIGQVLVNLINNACDSVRNQEDRQIEISLKELNGNVEIAVKDNGPGVPVEVAKRIFDPFLTTKGVGAGTGLGLSISNTIMGAHAGRIELRSRHNPTEFVLRWPTFRKRTP